MLTFTELRFLLSESVFLKYSGYILPLLLFLLTKHVWQRFALKTNKASSRKEVIDISSNIQTDSNDDVNDGDYKPHLEEREHVPYRGIAHWLDKNGDTFYRLANDRRSIRKFARDKPVDIRLIEKCILASGETISFLG